MGSKHVRRDQVERLIDVGNEMYARGWMLATAGNLSARVDSDPVRYVVTASGGHKGRLAEQDFVELGVGMHAPDSDRKTSAETVVHDRLYASRDIGAIVHVHSPYVTLVGRHFAKAGEVVFESLEYVKALGFWEPDARVRAAIVPNHHHIPDLARAVAASDGDAPAVIVAGHGQYAWGATVLDAQRHAEALEFLCHITWEELRAR
jgi:methylthioribulose-1-phosphate dehydratase